MRGDRYPFEVALQQSCFPPTTQRSLEDQTLMQDYDVRVAGHALLAVDASGGSPAKLPSSTP